MPSIADIVVLKNDGTTNVTYVAKAPSAGDSVPAVWRNESAGTAPAHFPEFRLVTRDVKKGLSRAARMTYVYPMTALNSTTNVTAVVERCRISADWEFPKGMTQATMDEAISQLANLLVSALVKSSLKAGYAPT
jgi:hypothetical protein